MFLSAKKDKNQELICCQVRLQPIARSSHCVYSFKSSFFDREYRDNLFIEQDLSSN